MASNQSLPVPEHLKSATQRAKIDEDALPVGGAPPVQIPNFADALPQNAVPKHVAEQQLPRQYQRPPRSPEEIKADFNRAAQILESGRITAPQNTPEQASTLQDTLPQQQFEEARRRHVAHDSAVIPPKGAVSVAAPPAAAGAVAASEPAKEDDEDDGPTLADVRDYPWRSYRHAMQREADYNREELKQAIEGRLKEVDVTDMILYESVHQLHPVIPGKLEVDFRTLTPEEDLYVKDELYKLEGSDRTVMDTMVLMTLACGMRSYNGVELPNHMIIKDGEREIDKAQFNRRLMVVMRIPIQVAALLSVVYGWFDIRMRKALVSAVLGKS